MRIRAIPLGALVALLFGLSAIALGQPSAPAKGDIEGLTFGAKADSKPAPRTFAIETFVSRTYTRSNSQPISFGPMKLNSVPSFLFFSGSRLWYFRA